MIQLIGRATEPSDPPSAGMRQLTVIACGYAPAAGAAASFGARPVALGLLILGGLAHAALANWHGVKRGEQAIRMLEVHAASTADVVRTDEARTEADRPTAPTD